VRTFAARKRNSGTFSESIAKQLFENKVCKINKGYYLCSPLKRKRFTVCTLKKQLEKIKK